MASKESTSTTVCQTSCSIQSGTKRVKNMNKKSYGEHEYVLGFTIKTMEARFEVCTAPR